MAEDTFTTTVDAAAAHARLLGFDDSHPLDCRCRDCIRDEVDLSDRGTATTAGVLLFLIFGGLALLAVLHLGQQAMCAIHDEGLRYCAGYSPTTETETP